MENELDTDEEIEQKSDGNDLYESKEVKIDNTDHQPYDKGVVLA